MTTYNDLIPFSFICDYFMRTPLYRFALAFYSSSRRWHNDIRYYTREQKIAYTVKTEFFGRDSGPL